MQTDDAGSVMIIGPVTTDSDHVSFGDDEGPTDHVRKLDANGRFSTGEPAQNFLI